MLVTPQLKDIVLRDIVEKFEVGAYVSVDRDEVIQGVGGDTLSELINHFERQGLLRFSIDRNGKKQSGTSDSIMFWINVESHDFIQQGGFYGRYELFQKTVEKLLWQVEKLERLDDSKGAEVKSIKDKISEYLAIIANASAIGGSIKGIID